MSGFCGDDRRSSLSEESMPFGTIRGPIRKGERDLHYPTYNPVENLTGHIWTYCAAQMASGNGFPPRQIDGVYNRPEKHFRQGVGIGDVGILDTDGGFSYYFNIFHPSDDPIQTSELPRNFKPIEPPLSEWEVRTTQTHFEPGAVIASEGISIQRVSDSPLKVDFSSAAFDGAVLVLPGGARRDDLVDVDRLNPYLKEHAADWYHFFNGYGVTGDEVPSPPIMNGTIYIITGSDRALTYANASFPLNSESSSDAQHRFTFDESHPKWWSDSGTAQVMARKEPLGKDNLVAVFYRGVTIALSSPLWLRNLPLIPFDEVPCYSIPSAPSTGGILARLERLLEARRGATMEPLKRRMRIPFHPSTILAQLLLQADPDADFAVVHDLVWCNLMNGRNPTHQQLPDLIHDLLNLYNISTMDGVVTFHRRGEGDDSAESSAKKSILSSLLSFWQKSPKTKALEAIPKVLFVPGKEYRASES